MFRNFPPGLWLPSHRGLHVNPTITSNGFYRTA